LSRNPEHSGLASGFRRNDKPVCSSMLSVFIFRVFISGSRRN
jgi:hypothetical protein